MAAVQIRLIRSQWTRDFVHERPFPAIQPSCFPRALDALSHGLLSLAYGRNGRHYIVGDSCPGGVLWRVDGKMEGDSFFFLLKVVFSELDAVNAGFSFSLFRGNNSFWNFFLQRLQFGDNLSF